MPSRRLSAEELQADERGVYSLKPKTGRVLGAAKGRAAKKEHDSLGNTAIEIAWTMFRVVMRKTNAEAIAVCTGVRDGKKQWAKRPSGLAPGWLDYTMFIPPTGHPVFVDAKTGAASKKKGQGLRPKQVEFIEQVKADGCSVIVLTGRDQFIDELRAIVNREQRKDAVLREYGGYQEDRELRAKL